MSEPLHARRPHFDFERGLDDGSSVLLHDDSCLAGAPATSPLKHLCGFVCSRDWASGNICVCEDAHTLANPKP